MQDFQDTRTSTTQKTNDSYLLYPPFLFNIQKEKKIPISKFQHPNLKQTVSKKGAKNKNQISVFLSPTLITKKINDTLPDLLKTINQKSQTPIYSQKKISKKSLLRSKWSRWNETPRIESPVNNQRKGERKKKKITIMTMKRSP